MDPLCLRKKWWPFENANLAKVNFEGANLFTSSFKGANLYEANLLGANISGAIFDEANFIVYLSKKLGVKLGTKEINQTSVF